MTKLSNRLKELRKINHFNQEYVASYLDISRQAYSHYETGRNIPPAESLMKLAKLYDLPTDDFLSLISSVPSYTHSLSQSFDYLDDFLTFINKPENHIYHPLKKNEKILLYFYQKLSVEDQEDFIEFLKIRTQHHPRKDSSSS